jgi:hypothetical protein
MFHEAGMEASQASIVELCCFVLVSAYLRCRVTICWVNLQQPYGTVCANRITVLDVVKTAGACHHDPLDPEDVAIHFVGMESPHEYPVLKPVLIYAKTEALRISLLVTVASVCGLDTYTLIEHEWYRRLTLFLFSPHDID